MVSLLALGMLAVPSVAAGASTGGDAAPTDPSGGVVEYGTAAGVPPARRPVAAVFRVGPHTIVSGVAPHLALRIDQRGVPTVAARVVFWPLHGNGKVLRIDLGRVPTGTLLHPAWPAGTTLAAGRYIVRVHARDPAGATLLRRAKASGRAPLTVKPAPVAPVAPVVPIVPAAPVVPVVAAGSVIPGGIFPVQGIHNLGGPDNRFGAARTGHVHEGQDILAAEGTPVVAPVAGTIVARDYQASAAGYYLAMDAVDGRSFFFAHCQKDTFAVALGQVVTAGQQLCRVGQTGDATTPHLHFEIWLGGWRKTTASKPVDPLAQLLAWGG